MGRPEERREEFVLLLGAAIAVQQSVCRSLADAPGKHAIPTTNSYRYASTRLRPRHFRPGNYVVRAFDRFPIAGSSTVTA